MQRKDIKLICFFVFIFIIVFLLMVCSQETEPKKPVITHIGQLEGKKIANETGSSLFDKLDTVLTNYERVYINDSGVAIEALKSGKVEGLLYDEPVARLLLVENPEFKMLPVFAPDEYAFAFSKDDINLQGHVNHILGELWEDGTMEKLSKKWFLGDETAYELEDVLFSGKNGTLVFGTEITYPPFSFMRDNEEIGYDVDLARIIASRMGCNIEIVDIPLKALIPAVVTGKCDFAGGSLSATVQRAQSVLFSTPTYYGGAVVVVLDTSYFHFTGWIERVMESFNKTFIVEDRYQMILEGVQTTLIISFLALLMGIAVGAAICSIRLSKHRFFSSAASVFVEIMQGVPVLLVLMMFYYVAFAKIDISPIVVAVIVFGLSFGASASEIFRMGILSTDINQVEAATALGYTPLQCFFKITLPQALMYILPVFKGEFVGMIKSTSVVALISIQDLTNMGDRIRSSTFEAFFPLVAVSAIYFAITHLIAMLINYIYLQINPQNKKSVIKGVSEDD